MYELISIVPNTTDQTVTVTEAHGSYQRVVTYPLTSLQIMAYTSLCPVRTRQIAEKCMEVYDRAVYEENIKKHARTIGESAQGYADALSVVLTGLAAALAGISGLPQAPEDPVEQDGVNPEMVMEAGQPVEAPEEMLEQQVAILTETPAAETVLRLHNLLQDVVINKPDSDLNKVLQNDVCAILQSYGIETAMKQDA